MSLHIGDRILEINGTPVKETPIESVENLLRYSDKVLQLTIEHDPEAISRRIQTLKKPQQTPLTTTASDTNIPNSNKLSDEKGSLSNSCENVEEKHESNGNSKGSQKQERLFKRKDEGYMSGTRSRQLRRKNHIEHRQSLDKERSSSMSRLLDE